MADIHVLTGDGLGKWTMVFHYTVPDANNAIGTSYRTALKNSGLGGTSQMEEGAGPGQIAGDELALIAAGELYEFSISLPAESGATDNAEMLAFIRVMYAQYEAEVMADLQKRLRYYGYTATKE
jgi:hypothetical protein